MHTNLEPSLNCNEVFRLISEGKGTLIDVRGYDEFAAGHADGAKCIPLPELEKRIGEVPTDAPVCVMCASGNRSAMAVERLRALGILQVVDVCGGYQSWKQAGLPAQVQKGVIPLDRKSVV